MQKRKHSAAPTPHDKKTRPPSKTGKKKDTAETDTPQKPPTAASTPRTPGNSAQGTQNTSNASATSRMGFNRAGALCDSAMLSALASAVHNGARHLSVTLTLLHALLQCWEAEAMRAHLHRRRVVGMDAVTREAVVEEVPEDSETNTDTEENETAGRMGGNYTHGESNALRGEYRTPAAPQLVNQSSIQMQNYRIASLDPVSAAREHSDAEESQDDELSFLLSPEYLRVDGGDEDAPSALGYMQSFQPQFNHSAGLVSLPFPRLPGHDAFSVEKFLTFGDAAFENKENNNNEQTRDMSMQVVSKQSAPLSV